MAVLVGKKAPDFKAPAVMGDNSINEDFHLFNQLDNRYGILFFYPMDFTFVCPTEIIAFDNHYDEFQKRECELIAVSCDSQYVHLAWKQTPLEQGGIGKVRFPMVADITKRIASDYDVLIDNDFVLDEHGNLVPILGGSIALRGLFLIDKRGFVRHQLVNDKPLGRSVEEALRMLDALQYFEQHGEVCPANWKPGKQGLKTTSADVGEFLHQYSKTL